jgi:hypothetical protein
VLVASALFQQFPTGDHMRFSDLRDYLSGRENSPQLSVSSSSTALVVQGSYPTSVQGSLHGSDQGSYPGSTLGSTLEAVPDLYPVVDDGVIVGVTRNPNAELLQHPKTHAQNLLGMLMADKRYAGQPMTSLAIEQYYGELCRLTRSKRLPWMAVVRPFYRTLDAIYGNACYKGSKPEYFGSRTKRLRTCRIPTLAETQAAQAARNDPSVVALHQRG